MIIQNKRILQIIKLLNKNNKFITGKCISESVGVSSRTIRTDMKEVAVLLANKGAHLISKPGRGYTMSIDNKEKYSTFIDEYVLNTSKKYNGINIVPSDYNDRISFIIARILLNSLHNKVVFQEDLSDELFISLSTLKKYLGDIKKSIARFELKLTTDRKNGIKIVGDEAKLRFCISEYVFSRDDLLNLSGNKFFNDIFPKQEIEAVKHILLKIILKYNIHLTDIAFKNLLVHIIITMRRSGSKNTVEYTANEQNKLKKSPYFNPSIEVLDIVNMQLGVDIKNEVYYLTQHFIASQKFMESGQSSDHFKALGNMIISQIKDSIGIDLSDDNELITGIMMHLTAAISRLKFNMNIRNDILYSIKDKYPLAFDMAVIASEIIEREESVRTNENEIGFLAIHFGAALERNKFNSEKGKTAVIVCGTGLSTALLLKSKLQRKFGNILQIKRVMGCYELNEKIIASVDFIFSTVPVNQIRSDKIIRVEPIMTEEDLQYVENEILNKANKNIVKNTLCKIFPERNFYVNQFQTKNESINFLTNAAIQNGVMDEKTKQSVFEREKLSSTYVGNLSVILHPIYNNTESSFISALILQKPILWDDFLVQVIFLVETVKGDCEFWETIVKQLYLYIRKSIGIQSLIEEKTYKNFLQTFFKLSV